MKTQIFYFSGTGNSLYIAKELAKEISNTTLQPIISVLSMDKIVIEAEKIGFVFPIHAFSIPEPVKQFLKRVNIKTNSYIFAVATRGGSPCRVFKEIDKILEKKDKKLDAQFFINMPNNYLPIFEVAPQEEILKLQGETKDRIGFIKDIIINNKESKEKDSHGSFIEENILFPVLTQVFHKTGYFNTQNKFYSDDKCTSCKICSEICLSGKIKMKDGKPKWDKNIQCTYCFACIHYCPVKAIQIKNTKTNVRGRYHHEGIDGGDIASQK
ncbi:EFR1 family ferrodoxin [Clostridium sp.]|jgi:NAD-dependent dihydropyrimidine dehydrogenase PreA subunit/flavodoxin|uniref:EFR1 family ferrodoxin n=1 Tax=Clostridium sp. TaxID=1506 RepID=UPI00258C7CC1|nr:EFR1 family ferrodoxin [Clostridium sp.]MDF2504110.1 ferredoxin [Clostridium sp.]